MHNQKILPDGYRTWQELYENAIEFDNKHLPYQYPVTKHDRTIAYTYSFEFIKNMRDEQNSKRNVDSEHYNPDYYPSNYNSWEQFYEAVKDFEPRVLHIPEYQPRIIRSFLGASPEFIPDGKILHYDKFYVREKYIDELFEKQREIRKNELTLDELRELSCILEPMVGRYGLSLNLFEKIKGQTKIAYDAERKKRQ